MLSAASRIAFSQGKGRILFAVLKVNQFMNCFVSDPEGPFAFSENVLKPMPSAKTPELQTQESLHTQPPDYCLTAEHYPLTA